MYLCFINNYYIFFIATLGWFDIKIIANLNYNYFVKMISDIKNKFHIEGFQILPCRRQPRLHLLVCP